MNIYPLKFKNILQPKIWGGSKIATFKNIAASEEDIGESWEISSVEGHVSVVSNGILKGETLTQLIENYQGKLVGTRNYNVFGTTFPLLIKFIDARENLSLQVHPNDELAQKQHNSFGKTELWYTIDATPNALLWSGFKKEITLEIYAQSAKDNTIVDHIDKHEISKGDVFFLPAGRIHAIGAGSFIAEIQQTSDITYRIYDYNRRDTHGNLRQLHIEEARKAIDFKVYNDHKTEYVRKENAPVELGTCDYFTTNLLELTKPISRDFSQLDSFVIYLCSKGSCEISDDKNNIIQVSKGETILIAADTKQVKIVPHADTILLETYT